MPHLTLILFLFVLGACVGSFLNVVVWRMPRGKSLVSPPSHCPKCMHPLAWHDNIPVLGWILLRGKCRYCADPIASRYPIVEAVTGLLFVFFYVMFFIIGEGPCAPVQATTTNVWGETIATRSMMTLARDWPVYALYMFLIGALLASSLIDAELFIIPIEIPWVCAGVGILGHAIFDAPGLPGALNANATAAALAAGAGLGLIVSLSLWWQGILPTSFPEGEPLLEVDRAAVAAEAEQARAEGRQPPPLPPPYTPRGIRREMRKEILFLLPPALLGFTWLVLTSTVEPVRGMWLSWMGHDWLTGLLGSILGALIGGFVVWMTRIIGTLGFGRVAMGLGDVHLMFGVGAILGAAGTTVAFFIAPFFGILLAIYMLLTGTRREMPFGPYLSLGTAAVMLFYCRIMDYLSPGMEGLVIVLHDLFT